MKFSKILSGISFIVMGALFIVASIFAVKITNSYDGKVVPIVVGIAGGVGILVGAGIIISYITKKNS